MAGYRLEPGPPGLSDYLLLRSRSGLSPRREDQAVAALPGSWAAVHAVHEATGDVVGMGRVLGDGGWYAGQPSESVPAVEKPVDDRLDL